MCIRAGGENELESVKNLMSMSLMAIISDSLDVEIDEIENSDHLQNDLKMIDSTRQTLEEQIADIFDGLQLDLTQIDTVGTLLELVVYNEFKDVAEHLPGGNFLQHPAFKAAA
ncbi:MAG TPA: hypothetical protein ENH92_05385 [Ectothiorhodospiraceae bacterium]|nr:hypothetical protein [Ectothiorhodospiraceae bacterium]